MKKFILLVLTILLAGILYMNFQPNMSNTKPINVEQTTTTKEDSASQVEVISSESTMQETTIETTAEETTVASLFNEEVLNNRDYPLADVPTDLLNVDIYTAINTYYVENYSDEEKVANQTALTDEELTNLATVLNDKETLKGLELTVDQVSMTLADQKVYIPRIIVPVTYENAQRIAADNDINILTEALTEIGNRLIMIAYYNPQNDQLLVYHLTNWTKPLFTYQTAE